MLGQISILTSGLYLSILVVLIHMLLSKKDDETGVVRTVLIALGFWNVATGILIAIIGASAASDESARMLAIYLGAGLATITPALGPSSALNSFQDA